MLAEEFQFPNSIFQALGRIRRNAAEWNRIILVRREGDLNRRLQTASVVAAFLIASAVLLPLGAQQKNAVPQPNTQAEQSAGNPTKGREVYSRNCAICHYPASTQKKVGPGLKEIYKRGQFADGKKVNDATMRAWIENGGKQMPPYNNVLSRQQLADVIAYLKTL